VSEHLFKKKITIDIFKDDCSVDGYINLPWMINIIKKDAISIAVVNMILMLLAVFIIWNYIPVKYKSYTLLSPAVEGAMSSGVGQKIGGIASFMGVDLGGGGGNMVVVAIESMKSRRFVNEFLSKHEFDAELYTVVGWNRRENKNIYDLEKAQDKKNYNGMVTTSQIYKKFLSMLTVNYDEKNYLIKVEVESLSPVLSRSILSTMVSDINSYMQKEEIDKADKNIQYLNQKITDASKGEMKEVLYRLLEEQLKKKMLAESQPEFAFRTIDPAFIPEEPSSPPKYLVLAFCIFVNVILTVFFFLVLKILIFFSSRPTSKCPTK